MTLLSRLRCWRASLRRKPKRHLVPMKVGDTMILVHDGNAWQALILERVTSGLNAGTEAVFTSLDRHMPVTSVNYANSRAHERVKQR